MFGINDNQSNQPNDGQPAVTAADSQPVVDSQPSAPPLDDTPAGPPASEDSLISLKEQALSSLSPLIGHLDQSPEEKFKTLMMLIQASDNSGLIKEAYEAANQITDERSRAQALLDIVNEINYFTQHHDDRAKA